MMKENYCVACTYHVRTDQGEHLCSAISKGNERDLVTGEPRHPLGTPCAELRDTPVCLAYRGKFVAVFG
jgi:hypothetical protein